MASGPLKLRLKLFGLSQHLTWPLRAYVRWSPILRGKTFIARRLIAPMLPPAPALFDAKLFGGAKARLGFHEVLGLEAHVWGGFETAEMQYLRSCLRPGTTFIDVGANVGVYTVAMAKFVQPGGKVMAFEPLEENVRRLGENVALNHLTNVVVHASALGDRNGEITLKLASDPAYPSVLDVGENRATGCSRAVPITKLDTVWEADGSPPVSAIKVDVEGAELMVLRGSEKLLAACRPTVQVEANTAEHLNDLAGFLCPRGYHHLRPVGFKRWNHAFSAGDNSLRTMAR